MSTPRSVVLERLAYTLAAPVLAVAPNVYPDSPVNQVVQLAGAAGIGGWILAAKSDAHGAGRKILRWSPWSWPPPSTSPPRPPPAGDRGGWTACSPPVGRPPATS